MKSIQYLFFLVAFSATLASCDSLLDLEPAQSISEELALENDANIKAVLVGAYDELGADNLFGGNALRNSELLGANNEVQWVGHQGKQRWRFGLRVEDQGQGRPLERRAAWIRDQAEHARWALGWIRGAKRQGREASESQAARTDQPLALGRSLSPGGYLAPGGHRAPVRRWAPVRSGRSRKGAHAPTTSTAPHRFAQQARPAARGLAPQPGSSDRFSMILLTSPYSRAAPASSQKSRRASSSTCSGVRPVASAMIRL